MEKDNGRRVPITRYVITPGALSALLESQESPEKFIARHVSGDWGEVPPEDAEANNHALEHGERLLSAYRTRKGTRLWIITEADRSITTILLPDEY